MTKKVGQIIKERRLKLNMSKSAFARMLGCSPQNIDSLENRKSIDFELAQKICELLDFDLFSYYSISSKREQTEKVDLELKLQEIKDKYTALLEKHTQLLERITMQQQAK